MPRTFRQFWERYMQNPLKTDNAAVEGYVNTDRQASEATDQKVKLGAVKFRKEIHDTMNNKTKAAAKAAVTKDRRSRS